MSNNRAKKSPPPTPPSSKVAPEFRCEVMGEYFKIGNKFCQLLEAVAAKDNLIDTSTLIKRGRVKGIDASMEMGAANLFHSHLKHIPPEFEGYRIVFPEATTNDGRIKFLQKSDGTWFMFVVPTQTEWQNGDLLARLVDSERKLLVNTAAIMRNV
ncbi:MAG: hypothetical protein A2534_02135 [Candidatus Magasanikbacteria bacterium RIFOXYD2_FULL_39_9]|uniref:Uncharacterized protein n=1 Tax=Candidatus Magasanikbacteria bacterium RIFOXYD1_FULL_40_23 TaxID=1798705 RepID=A0A1F6P7A1_9BACT|nr:MAG: hypothetical protein A2563_00425 [Candidatus Magasanikbacteria bacterium RIFOXYD1_FULL_40_23]OGH93499.1 MAG: hypothetical protein A2534_02135 [Candidatus Magasanikbacteria bacterium RIFOXYD2_FULL_39_9]